ERPLFSTRALRQSFETCSSGTQAGKFAKRQRGRGPLVLFSVRVAAVFPGAQLQRYCTTGSIRADSIGTARHIRGATSRSFRPTFGSGFGMLWMGGSAARSEEH